MPVPLSSLAALGLVISSTAAAPESNGPTHSRCLAHSDCDAESSCFFASQHDLAMKRSGVTAPHGVCVTYAQKAAFMETEEGSAASASSTAGKGGVETGRFALKVPEGNMATVRMGADASDDSSGYEIKVSPSGELEIGARHNSGEAPYLKIGKNGEATTNVRKIRADALDAKGGFTVRGTGGEMVRQWSLAASDSWDVLSSDGDKARGWGVETGDMADPTPQMCGGTSMLGGPSNGDGDGLHAGEISKTFTGLAKHTSVRISATFHFIDLWLGEFAYMKLSSGSGKVGSDGATVDELVWTKSYHAADTAAGLTGGVNPPSGLNVCGDPNIVEMEFSTTVDVAVPHVGDQLKVTFGTRLPATSKAIVGGASWGVSRVGVYIKDVAEE
jgi:hypothetical protein